MADPVYAAVVKSDTKPQSPPPIPPREHIVKNVTVKLNLLDNLVKVADKNATSRDSDLNAFYNMVRNLRAQYNYNDPDTNMGLVISPMVNYEYKEGTSIKLCVYPDFEGADIGKPVNFTCDGNLPLVFFFFCSL